MNFTLKHVYSSALYTVNILFYSPSDIRAQLTPIQLRATFNMSLSNSELCNHVSYI